MTNQLRTFIDQLSPDWDIIKEQALKYCDNESSIRDDGAAQFYKRSWVAPLNFGIVLFPSTDQEYFKVFEQKFNFSIPDFYKKILFQLNGCFIYDFSLFGLPASMYTDGLLNRSTLQQFDLGTANRSWKYNYKIPDELFYIGSNCYSEEENNGYFLDKQNNIVSILENGRVVNSWSAFDLFLKSEIGSAEEAMLKEKQIWENNIP